MSYKKWVFVAIFLFIVGLIFGLVAPAGITSPVLGDIEDALRGISSIIVPFSPLTVLFIFFKNALALLISFALSPILCLVPVLSLITNGLVIISVSSAVVQQQSLGYLLLGLLPHGIIEIPAFIIGEAAALSFGAMIILALFRKHGRELLVPLLKKNFRYLVIALALLLPAAIIETYVTPLLLI